MSDHEKAHLLRLLILTVVIECVIAVARYSGWF